MENRSETTTTVEDILDAVMTDEAVVELADSDDLWWVLGGSNWVLAGPQ